MACRSWTETGESRRLPADLVGLAVAGTALDPAAGHPDEESVGIVVAAVAFFRDRHPAELAAPDDERRVEQPALLEIGRAGPRPACRFRDSVRRDCRRGRCARPTRRCNIPARTARRARPDAGPAGTFRRRDA